jgi:galactonate dehydratase
MAAGGYPALAQLRDNSQLKVARVEPYLVRIGDRSAYPLVRVETAEGLYGWGEGTTPPSSPAVLTQIRESGKLILNQSAWDIEKLWRQMYIAEENTLGGTLFAAISAIDIALWDIIGKRLNVPVYKLLAGRGKMPSYTNRCGSLQRFQTI